MFPRNKFTQSKHYRRNSRLRHGELRFNAVPRCASGSLASNGPLFGLRARLRDRRLFLDKPFAENLPLETGQTGAPNSQRDSVGPRDGYRRFFVFTHIEPLQSGRESGSSNDACHSSESMHPIGPVGQVEIDRIAAKKRKFCRSSYRAGPVASACWRKRGMTSSASNAIERFHNPARSQSWPVASRVPKCPV